MERILILTDGTDWQEVSEMLRGAKACASVPDALSFGLCLSCEPSESDQHGMAALGSLLFICGSKGKWQKLQQLWQGETYLLMANADLRFLPGWDKALLSAWRQTKRSGPEATVLTGFPPCPEDQLCTMRTVCADALDDRFTLSFGAGTAVRYAAAPVPSFFLNPDFCFGAASFFRKMAEREAVDFLNAQACGEKLFTLHRTVCTAVHRNRIPTADLSHLSERDATLCRRAGINLAKREAEPMARLGIGYPDLRYPMRIPQKEQLESRLVLRLPQKGISPLCVTSYVTSDNVPLPDDQVLRFRHLTDIEDTAVLCYADSASARRVMLFYPNVLEYKPQYALQVDRRIGHVDADNYARLCRPFLLAQTMERFLTNSHYVWIDFDYLGYPVNPREHLAWEILCTDRITMASVNGIPDTSMIVVPDNRLQPLCREIIVLCDAYARSKHILPEETDLWQTLIHDHADWFDLIDLPGPKELLGISIRSVNESWKITEKD